MGRRTKQSLKKRSKTHRVRALKTRKRHSRAKATRRRHQARSKRKAGGKK
jgi:hypothetical protein